MPSKGGLALKSGDSILRALEFLCSALLLGIFSWFLAYLSKHHQHEPTWMKACEGISGAAVIYTAFATLLTCFLGGITGFAILAIILDVLFCGAFLAIAVMARHGIHTSGSYSPLGNRKTRDAKLQTAAFAVAIIGAFLFLITAAMAVLLMKKHKKDKKYGPSPSNNYTSGSGTKPAKRSPFAFLKRNKKPKHRDAEEMGALGGGNAVIAEEKAHHRDHSSKEHFRPSHDTGMTGTTAAQEPAYGGSPNKYQEYAAPQSNGYNAYPPQGTTTAPGTQYAPTSESNYGHGVNQQSGVIHDPQPYAPMHGTGAIHQEGYVR